MTTHSTEFDYIKSFKEQMVEFLDELIDMFPTDGSFILIRVFVNDKIPVTAVLGRFMRDCLKYHNYVKTRNDKLFLSKDFLYNSYGAEVGIDQIDRFRDIWQKELDNEDKKMVWSWMDLFYKLSMNYYKRFGPVEDWEFNLDEEIKKLANEEKKFVKK
tara:strand:- start:27 stop:500 length:474 start_codon:yes stop_codon:yes gene_type:complete